MILFIFWQFFIYQGVRQQRKFLNAETESFSTENKEGVFQKVNADTKVLDVIHHPAFEGFGQFLFPIDYRNPDENMTLGQISSLLPYHNNINTETTTGVLNSMIDMVTSGKKIFYDIYTDEEKPQIRAKKTPVCFFFQGKSNAPFAIISAGGGFAYVGSIHESFPHALELSRRGYNAFALSIPHRRSRCEACEDLAAAISFVFAHRETLGVSTDCYSLWGGSAGARMAAYLGSYSRRSSMAMICPDRVLLSCSIQVIPTIRQLIPPPLPVWEKMTASRIGVLWSDELDN